MDKKIIKIALIGKTNAGKSTLINSIVGEEISIINKKINTTQETVLGIKNIDKTQIIFYDTPGSNFLKTASLNQKKLKTNLWQAIDSVDFILYLIDTTKYTINDIRKDILKLSEVKKPIVFVFNKIDLLENKIILPYINELKNIDEISDFFLISAKFVNGIDKLLYFFTTKSYEKKWVYNNDELTDKDDIYITNECTRNSILKYIHKEIPYNINVVNKNFKYLSNNDLKVSQYIEISNPRYKPILLGKKGVAIKNIREDSQAAIKNILNCKVHLYIQIVIKDEK